MKNTYKYICLFIILISMIVLPGCDQGVKEEELIKILEGRNIDEITEFIDSYKEQKNKNELDNIVIKDFKKNAESTDYNDFVYMEKFVKKVNDEALKTNLQKIIDDNVTNKVIAYTTGKWVRRDYSTRDGMLSDLKWSNDKGFAILIKSPTSDYSKGDVKWNDIEVVSDTEFVYEDLAGESYYKAYGKIDYDKNQLICHVSTFDEKSMPLGSTQVWVKEELIDSGKETLTEKELKQMGLRKEYKEGLENKDIIWSWWYNAEEKEVRSANLRDGINLKAKRNDIIDKYGYGHIIYQSYKKDPIYNIQSSSEAPHKDLILNIKKSKYAVIYKAKKSDKFLKMYFNSKDKLTVLVVGHDYNDTVAYWS